MTNTQTDNVIGKQWPSNAAWREWFKRMGELATVSVVNATATLVIAERDEVARLSAPAPSLAIEQIALSGECDNDAHSNCPYSERCRCACHRPEGLTAAGDERCARCGHVNNVPWFAPSPLWNQVVRANNHSEMLCPMCFMKLAEESGVKTTGWQLIPEAVPSVAMQDEARAIVANEDNDTGLIARITTALAAQYEAGWKTH